MSDKSPEFIPTANNSRQFRNALGCFGTGVTIVTIGNEGTPLGITVNSFASVSLDPALVLWSPAKASKRFEHFAGSLRFAVHVLSADQRDVCAAIIKSKTAIADVPHSTSHCGMPIITGALATFECTLSATHDAGDHVIVVGEVTKCHHQPGEPMVFHGGKYGKFSES